MRDPTFNLRTLEGQLLTNDFARDRALGNPARRTSVLNDALATSRLGFASPLRLKTSILRNKSVYQFENLSDLLILRLITQNIRRLTGVKQGNRDAIIRSLRVILTEGINYRVYKVDVRNFYETVEVQTLVNKLASDQTFPRDSLRLLRSFFSEAQRAGINGLPRGIAISATLSEYVMRSFDTRMSNEPHVYFYSRFVDDLLVLTTGKENPRDFLQLIRESLFPGLFLNPSKTRFIDLQNATKGSKGLPAASFDFLGYQFNIHERQNSKSGDGAYREVHLDIASRKVKRLKTRIAKSFVTFLSDRRFDDLHDRLRILAGNYNLYDDSRQVRRNSGLYCNYRLVDFEKSASLPQLDRFLHGLVLSRTGIFGGKPTDFLTKKQKRELLKITFTGGFRSRVFYHFSPARLHDLMSCWAYA